MTGSKSNQSRSPDDLDIESEDSLYEESFKSVKRKSVLNGSKLSNISGKVSSIKIDICNKLSVRDTNDFTKVTAKNIAECSSLKKQYLAEKIISLINLFEPLAKFSTPIVA